MMDLRGPGGNFSTLAPEDAAGWGGGYFSNDGQRVTAEDARELAAALERALPDVPDHDALRHKARPLGNSGEFGIPVGTPTTPSEWFSGDRKQRLREFIAFCRAGGFVIR